MIIFLIILVPTIVIGYVTQVSSKGSTALVYLGDFLIDLIIMIVVTLYFGVMEGMSANASFGKMIFGLKVVDAQGNGLSMGLSFLRAGVKALLTFQPICCIGPILSIVSLITVFAAADAKAIHDYVAGTIVVEPQQS